MPKTKEEKAEQRKKWRKANPGYIKKYLEDNPDYNKNYYNANKEKITKYDREKYKINREKIAKYNKMWNANNADYNKNYIKKRRTTDPLYKLILSARVQVHRILKFIGTNKEHQSFEYIGCTPKELLKHLEKQFLPGMNWSNYSKNGWHIDHIRPLSSFTQETIMQANHYTNLQPLWAKDNLSKGAKQ